MMNISGKTVALFPSLNPGAPLVVLNGEAGEGAAVCAAVRGMTHVDFTLALVSGLCWADDLTPWPSPPSPEAPHASPLQTPSARPLPAPS